MLPSLKGQVLNIKFQEALAQYIMRNAFAEEKISYIEDSGQVLYRSGMTHGKNKKNFELLPAGQFIARVTQHIPEKGFQMVRYYAGTQTGQEKMGSSLPLTLINTVLYFLYLSFNFSIIFFKPRNSS